MINLPTKKSKKETDISHFTYLIFGEPKIGKTTFAAAFDNALFLCTEPGHKFQEIYKIDVATWQDMRDAVEQLLTSDHKFKNVIIDTADNAYKMCEHWVCKKKGIEHPSDEGYGKGFGAVRDEFHRVVLAITQKGYGLVFISHAQTMEEEVDNVKRSVTDCTLSGSARKVVRGLCDFIFYCYADNSGERFIRTKGTKSIKAGDRGGNLPEIMPLDFKAFREALNASVSK